MKASRLDSASRDGGVENNKCSNGSWARTECANDHWNLGMNVCVCLQRPKHIWMGIRVNEVINHGPTPGARDAPVTEHEGQQSSQGAKGVV